MRWLSIEPMLEPLKFKRLDLFHWIVIGGASRSSQTPECRPPIDWIIDLVAQADAAGVRVYRKPTCSAIAHSNCPSTRRSLAIRPRRRRYSTISVRPRRRRPRRWRSSSALRRPSEEPDELHDPPLQQRDFWQRQSGEACAVAESSDARISQSPTRYGASPSHNGSGRISERRPPQRSDRTAAETDGPETWPVRFLVDLPSGQHFWIELKAGQPTIDARPEGLRRALDRARSRARHRKVI